MKSVYLLATLDTKGTEAAFLRDLLEQMEMDVVTVDTGCIGEPVGRAEIERSDFFARAEYSLDQLRAQNDRGKAIAAAADAAERLLRRSHQEEKVAGVISIGGSAGTTIGTAGMRALPLGIPKLMVSTLASGQVRPYVGDTDLMMMNSVVDILGINRISRQVLTNAAAAMAGMVRHAVNRPADESSVDRPLIAATMFGVTTPCVEKARTVLEDAGFEVLVFHATGTGGQAMESLINDGLIAGVLDITTTELADELVGGILTAGPDRLKAASKHGIPQVVSVGATDMVNFGAPDTIPAHFADRQFYQHNPTVTLMRTTVDENRQLGELIGRRIADSTGPAAILLPAHGVSAIDAQDGPFEDRPAREALFNAIRETAATGQVEELDLHINDEAFAVASAQRLLTLIEQAAPQSARPPRELRGVKSRIADR